MNALFWVLHSNILEDMEDVSSETTTTILEDRKVVFWGPFSNFLEDTKAGS
jgi:hypothetical protein